MATPPSSGEFERDVVVIGGGGHVGLPLAIAFADRGARVAIYDVSDDGRRARERGQAAVRRAGRRCRCLSARWRPGRLTASTDPAIVGTAEHVVVVIGTPVDEHLNPNQTAIPKALGGCSPYLRDGQLLVLRSTVFPGVTALVEKMIVGLGVSIDVAFCPERIAEGKAMTELFELPQIVSARSPQGMDRAVKLFSLLTESDRRAVAGRGRAREAVHQRLALHQVRGRQPVLHDGQRPGPRLRADPQGPVAGLPAGGGHARGRLRRRAVPVQGHDAAGRVQPQQLRARPHRDDHQRGAAALPGAPARAEVRPVVDDRRHPRDGVQGRVGRHQVEPVLQAQADP